ncbi:hypothetical protein L6452_40308 [Arctium lappa]|uniref:Uncharacterized protein n=1 Tax=Arctium lappa TaxID=4217 RepID=A0ACB8XM53_ARCLA|nr:hypothetical protein L6452_40308 [Arctium lappa]
MLLDAIFQDDDSDFEMQSSNTNQVLLWIGLSSVPLDRSIEMHSTFSKLSSSFFVFFAATFVDLFSVAIFVHRCSSSFSTLKIDHYIPVYKICEKVLFLLLIS